MLRIVEQRYEAILQVEVPGRFVDGVDLDGPHANMIRDMAHSTQRVDQQKLPEALALNGPVYGQPAQKNDRYVNRRYSFRLIGGKGVEDHAVI